MFTKVMYKAETSESIARPPEREGQGFPRFLPATEPGETLAALLRKGEEQQNRQKERRAEQARQQAARAHSRQIASLD